MRINHVYIIPVASTLLCSALASGADALLAVNPPAQLSSVSTGACVPPPAGLVSWFRAEGDAADILGNNGMPSSGVAYGPGKVGQAFVLDGLNAYVRIPYIPSLRVTNALTLEAWVQPSRYADQEIITKWDAVAGLTQKCFALAIDPQGRAYLGLSPSGTDDYEILVHSNPDSVPVGQWTHVAATYDGSTIRVYINGVLQDSVSWNLGIYPGTNEVTIGSSGPFWLFAGKIDEPSIYSRALTAAEIQAIYNAGSAGKCSPGVPPTITTQPASQTILAGSNITFSVSTSGSAPLSYQWFKNSSALSGATNSDYFIINAQFTDSGTYSVVVSNLYGSATSSNAVVVVSPPPPCEYAPEGLVSWWRAEGDLLDASGANDGSYYAYPIAYGAGKAGSAFYGGRGCVWVPDAPSLRCTNGLTLHAWVNASSYSGLSPRIIVTKSDTPTSAPPFWVSGPHPNQNSYVLGTTNYGQLYFALSPNGRTNSFLVCTQALPARQWSFVAATYDGAAMRLYINGVLAAQKPYAAGIFPGTNNLCIGGYQPPANVTSGFPFAGYIDELCLYNRALSGSELLAIYSTDVTGLCQMPPAILQQPADQAVPLGEDALCSIAVSGTKPFRYQWRLNGQNLAGATNATLLLEKVQTNHVGAYSVLVSNAAGLVLSSHATLTLLPPPACVQPLPGLLSWWPGETNGLDAVSSNHLTIASPATYGPGKAGSAFKPVITPMSGGRILAPSTAPFNFGANQDFSFEAWIKAFAPTNGFQAPVPDDMFIVCKRYPFSSREGGRVHLSPGYYLSLSRGHLAFCLNAAPGYGSNATVVVGGPDLRDSMFHHIAVSVQRGATNGGNLYLDGQLLVTFDPTRHQGSLSNDYAFALGSFSSSSTASFFGLIDEPALYNRALSAAEILAIRQAGAAGRCKELPSITTQPLSRWANEGATATFTVTAEGTGNLAYQWRRNGVGLSGATGASLTLTNVQWANAGSYSVLITSAFGSVLSSNALLTVNHKPAFRSTSQVVFADTNCLGNVSLNGVAFDPDGNYLTFNPVPPGPYPVGTNLITLWATDSNWASNACSFQVIVLDRTPPVMVCPPSLVLTNAHDQWTSVATFALPVVSDACSSVSAPQCLPPSGTAFGIGVHPVHCFTADSAGNFRHAIFTVTVWPGNVPPEAQIEVAPPARFPGYTNLIVIARDGRQATVTFDGSKSYDLDDTNLFYFWLSGTNLFSTNKLVTATLPVGSHEVALWVDDTFPLGTNAVSLTVDVVTPAQSVGILFEMLENSGLPRKTRTPLQVSLAFGAAFLENGRTKLGLSQLEAFQHNVRTRVTPLNRPLAAKLVGAAQTIINQCQNKSQPNRK